MNAITKPAWEEDEFWRELVNLMTGGKKLRSDAYLQFCTAEDLDLLQVCLSSGLPFVAIQQKAPPWRGGQFDGKPPGVGTLSEIASAMRQMSLLNNLERQQMINAATKARANVLGVDPSLVDTVLRALSEEALKRQADGMADGMLGKAASALLKREDQSFNREKFKEATRKKVEAGMDELATILEKHPDLLAEFKAWRTKLSQRISE